MNDAGPPGVELAAAARAARRLGLFGGTFDPPHRGHLHVARAARRAFGLDHVVFVPATRSPHKRERPLAPGAERLRMLEILLEEEGGTSIWTEELDRGGASYTVDTVRRLRARVGGETELFLLLGSDNLAGLGTWYRIEELLSLAHPIVVRRRGEPLDLAALARLVPGGEEGARRWLLDVAPFDASASEIRARLARGEAPGAAVPPALGEYLCARGIYGDRDAPS